MTEPTATAVVALKRLVDAKSRLTEFPPVMRQRWVLAMATDTLRALLAHVRVVIVSDEPSLRAHLRQTFGADAAITVIADGQPNLNAALTHGAQWARRHEARTVLAVVADLPALQSADVAALLAATGTGEGRWFVADRFETGTTFLVARGLDLAPTFGPDSAALHRASGAQEIQLPLSARTDVDTLEDLAAYRDLIAGSDTRRLLTATGRPASYLPVTTMADGRMVTDQGVALRLEPDALAGIRYLAPGQRVHAAVDGERVLSVWW